MMMMMVFRVEVRTQPVPHRAEFFRFVDGHFHVVQSLLVVLRVALREIESRHCNTPRRFQHTQGDWAGLEIAASGFMHCVLVLFRRAT